MKATDRLIAMLPSGWQHKLYPGTDPNRPDDEFLEVSGKLEDTEHIRNRNVTYRFAFNKGRMYPVCDIREVDEENKAKWDYNTRTRISLGWKKHRMGGSRSSGMILEKIMIAGIEV